jgi:hypothetical protein
MIRESIASSEGKPPKTKTTITNPQKKLEL